MRGRLVVRWVTTGEHRLLYVFFFPSTFFAVSQYHGVLEFMWWIVLERLGRCGKSMTFPYAGLERCPCHLLEAMSGMNRDSRVS
ncbi:hypothetical protein HDV57DRAFT_502707 [Trichoderma longibrachiatum]